MLDKLIFLIALAGTAVVFADILVRPGMLLEPVQRWLRLLYTRVTSREIVRGYDPQIVREGKDLDAQWWWLPLWGCYKCVAGQWGFWGYLIYLGRHLAAGPESWLLRYWLDYSLFEHLAFTAFTIIAAIIIQKWTQQ